MASVIPNLFNRVDFWAMLLPGYVTIISVLVLFFPLSLSISSDNGFNIFSAIVFLVAGPAIGFTLSQFAFIFVSLFWHKNTIEYEREYAKIKLDGEGSGKQYNEFENIDAKINFSRSTGIGLTIVASLLILWQPNCYPLNTLLNYPAIRIFLETMIYWAGIILLLASINETVNVRRYLICKFTSRDKIGKDEYERLCGIDDKNGDDIRKTETRNSMIVVASLSFGLFVLFFGIQHFILPSLIVCGH